MNKINDWLEQQQQRWQADFVAVARQITDSNGCLVIKWTNVVGQQSLAYQKIKLQIGKGLAGEIWKTGRCQMMTNLQQKKAELYNYPIARIEQLDMVMGAPVFHQSQLIAVVILGYRHQQSYSFEDCQHFAIVANDLVEILLEVK